MTSRPPTSESLLRIERELGVLVHRVRTRTVQHAAAVHPELLPAALPVLLYVVDHDGARASDVVEHFGIDKGAVSRHVGHLEALGLVSRTCDPGDRRAHTIVATADARSRVVALRQRQRRTMAGRLSGWTPEELDALARQLARYNASIEADRPD